MRTAFLSKMFYFNPQLRIYFPQEQLFLSFSFINVKSTVIEDRLANGLIAGHAYSVTGVSSVSTAYPDQIGLPKVQIHDR